MELDTKQKLLLALYTEYQKDLPNMKSVTAEIVGFDENVFNVAIIKLQTEGYITDVIDVTSFDNDYPDVMIHNLKLTRDGIDYVETKLGINPTDSGSEKVKEVAKKVVEWGWKQGKEIIVKIASELIKGSV